MAKKLKTLANIINHYTDKYRAYIEEGYFNTDRKIPGTRLRSPGKGRYGNKLVVFDTKTGNVVFTHNAAETYRMNYEVEDWIKENIPEAKL